MMRSETRMANVSPAVSSIPQHLYFLLYGNCCMCRDYTFLAVALQGISTYRVNYLGVNMRRAGGGDCGKPLSA